MRLEPKRYVPSMTEAFIALHKAKHLFAHVLVAAGVRRWPGTGVGDSGETATGFFADFALTGAPDDEELAALGDGMARVLSEFQSFTELELTPAQAIARFREQPWKRQYVEALAESEASIRCFELDGVVDVCDCVLKDPRELRALHPEKFLLTSAHPWVWSYRGRDELFVRVSGEIFPAPPPCACCARA